VSRKQESRRKSAAAGAPWGARETERRGRVAARLPGAAGLLLLCGVVAALLLLLCGCGGGGPTFQMKLDRDVTEGKPIWVGVYLLAKETALDGKEIPELTNKESAKALGASDGVIDHYVQPVYVGETPIVVTPKKYDPFPAWVLIVANFPKAGECARVKLPVKKGDDLKLRVSVDDKCLKIHHKFD
jgi:hypothetical protein